MIYMFKLLKNISTIRRWKLYLKMKIKIATLYFKLWANFNNQLNNKNNKKKK